MTSLGPRQSCLRVRARERARDREREGGRERCVYICVYVRVWRGEMAPFPDEVDVFTGPHWRMKQLVGLYCDKVEFISLKPACKQAPDLIPSANPSVVQPRLVQVS